MHIIRLSIKGFKTFARPVDLAFTQGLTAIVGPNGAGKSNLTEAIRWVLGEQSARRLRGGRMEEMLFHGSTSQTASSVAEVTLSLGEEGEEEPRFSLTRRLYRNGEGEYLLRGLPCRLRDVEQELLALGLSAGSPYYVGQNQVEEILRARPEERLRWLEEISGLGPFKAQRVHLEADLAAATAAMEQARQRHADLLRRLAPLQEMAARARAAQSLTREIGELERALRLSEVATLSRSLERLQGQAEREQEQAAVLAAAKERMKAVERSLGGTREWQQNRQVLLAGRLAREGERLRHLEERLHLLASEAQRAEADHRERQSEWQEQARRLGPVGSVWPDPVAVGESAEVAGRYLARRNRVQGEWDRWESRRMVLAEAIAAVGSGNTAAGEDPAALAALARAGEEAGGQREAARRRLAEAERVWTRGKREVTSLGRERDALQHRLEEGARGRGEGIPAGPSALLAAHRRGQLAGILGNVQGLLQVPAPYRVAIAAALGGAAHHIVVEREADAQAAIAHLKRGSLGRATLLPLELLRPPRRPEPLPALDGLVGWAVAQISFDPRVERAIHHALGSVVIVTALEPAFPIARATGLRLRIVTLDGEVIAPGGAVSGGTLPQRREGESLRLSLSALEERLRKERSRAAGLGVAFLRERRLLRRQTPAWEETVRQGREAAVRLDLLQQNGAREVRLQDARQQLQRAQRVVEALSAALVRLEERLPISLRGLSKAEQEAAAGLTRERSLLQEGLQRSRRLLDEAEGRLAAAEAERQSVMRQRDAAWQAQGRLQAVAEREERLTLLLVRLGHLLQPQNRSLEETEETSRRRREQGVREAARLAALLEERLDEVRRRYGGEALAAEPPVLAGNEEERLRSLRERQERLGPVNPLAEREARELEEEEAPLRRHLEDLAAAHEEVLRGVERLASGMEKRFREGFERVNEAFATHFHSLFGGGQAALRREGEGVDILAAPPGKRVQRLALLSGGERSLTSLALLFAFLQVRPSPFYILDEVEAALDDVNTGRVARHLAQAPGQFLVVTHQRRTMETAAAVYGVTMQEPGISSVVSVRLEEAAVSG